MAYPHAVLGLLDAPEVSDPGQNIVWSGFRQLRMYLSYRPDDIPRVYRLLDMMAAGRPGHGPIHLLLDASSEIGFAWGL